MKAPIFVPCEGVSVVSPVGAQVIPLAHGPKGYSNLHVGLDNFRSAARGIDRPLAFDLIRIASYVYAADRSVSRGGDTDVWMERWRRTFRFFIPVSEPDRWRHPNAMRALEDCLLFLTGDEMTFDFTEWETVEREPFLELFNREAPDLAVDCVSLFSGGLDSLAAAVDLVKAGRHPLFISHFSGTRFEGARRELLDEFRRRSAATLPYWTIPIYRRERQGVEETQRSRAYLFASLGCAAAICLGADEVYLSDNGITSLNLLHRRLAAGTQLTRGTNPGFIVRFNALMEALLGDPPKLINSLMSSTKGGVAQSLAASGYGELAGLTLSCANYQRKLRMEPHCGTCSQCIDRRFALEHAGLMAHESNYVTDLFTDDLGGSTGLPIALEYVRSAQRFVNYLPDAFLEENPAVFDAGDADEQVLMGWFKLHARFGKEVMGVFSTKLGSHASQLVAGVLPERCLLRVATSDVRRPERAAVDDLMRRLRTAVPKVFRGGPPQDEKAVQDAVDGLLSAAGHALKSEHPHIRFASKTFVPDHGSKEITVEVKYPRPTRKLTAIIDEMTSDVLPYIRTGGAVLFIVYDPHRMFTSEDEVYQDLADGQRLSQGSWNLR